MTTCNMTETIKKAVFIPAYQFYFGGTKKEALKAYKEYSEELKKALIDGYRYQIRLATICD